MRSWEHERGEAVEYLREAANERECWAIEAESAENRAIGFEIAMALYKAALYISIGRHVVKIPGQIAEVKSG